MSTVLNRNKNRTSASSAADLEYLLTPKIQRVVPEVWVKSYEVIHAGGPGDMIERVRHRSFGGNLN